LSPEPRIRPARAADIDALCALLDDLFSIERDFQPDRARQRRGLELLLAAGAQAQVLVAERDGVVVGMVSAQCTISTAEGAEVATLEDLVVSRAERGAGLGTALLRALEAWAAERGLPRLQLLADRDNAPALQFYAKAGWRETRLIALRRRPP
jgi:GNAT superfamily N-acetyltransferase